MIDLSNLQNMFGQVKPDVQKRLEAVLREQTNKTWDDAHCIIVDGFNTLWQYVIRLDPSFPKSARLGENYETQWERVPNKNLLIAALELAQANCREALK